ncbi:hypothetical protein RAJCM14343_3801 [Rhodococcus aetherivorans]|uniref:Uncharacterized protein n=1 Tax=Rhodococcus aetherivorans TaxID=191292 RepID=A0ABQ0YQ12_9NOCA|nr:hypothetical protein RAJCM14343_3801 [Rhodococcus aetherivorans]CCW12763.1 hypothetical protein EBESD8_33150 [Rhodococcus aetherivorans]
MQNPGPHARVSPVKRPCAPRCGSGFSRAAHRVLCLQRQWWTRRASPASGGFRSTGST